MKKCLFPIDALVVWCPTWSKNLGGFLIYLFPWKNLDSLKDGGVALLAATEELFSFFWRIFCEVDPSTVSVSSSSLKNRTQNLWKCFTKLNKNILFLSISTVQIMQLDHIRFAISQFYFWPIIRFSVFPAQLWIFSKLLMQFE